MRDFIRLFQYFIIFIETLKNHSANLMDSCTISDELCQIHQDESMSDYGKISWLSTDPKTNSGSKVNVFLELCKKLIPRKILLQSCEVIVKERVAIRNAQKKIVETISQQSFLAAFTVWVQEIASLNDETMNNAMMLLEHECIGSTDKDGKMWTILDARGFDHRIILDAIRCKSELSLQLREQLVSTYLLFLQWLSQETNGYVNKPEDPDWIKVARKVLSYPQFIGFATILKPKEQLVAKLLYYGGTPTLDEVLSVQLEDIDFKKKTIRYRSQLVGYPIHIFADIRTLIGKRNQGPLFLGRQDVPLRASTIFRNFKTAALKAGLDKSFSPALLTSSN